MYSSDFTKPIRKKHVFSVRSFIHYRCRSHPIQITCLTSVDNPFNSLHVCRVLQQMMRKKYDDVFIFFSLRLSFVRSPTWGQSVITFYAIRTHSIFDSKSELNYFGRKDSDGENAVATTVSHREREESRHRERMMRWQKSLECIGYDDVLRQIGLNTYVITSNTKQQSWWIMKW